jgi:RNA polymerase sigma-70 factor (sigma-E family)
MKILHRRSPDADLDFAEFVREVSPRLLRTAFLLCGNQDTAEDLVQEALERACRRWRRIAATEAPEAYVRRIVINLANDRWRRIGRARESDRLEVPDQPDPRDEYGRLDLRDQLTVMLETLPIRMRTIIVLRYFHDMDDARIADALGITPGAVRSQLSRGLSRLRGTASVEEGRAGPTTSDPPRVIFPQPRPHAAHPTVDLPLGGVQ